MVRQLGRFGLRALIVSLEESHDGLPLLLVEAVFPPDGFANAAAVREVVRHQADAELELFSVVRKAMPGTIPQVRLRIPDPSSRRVRPKAA